ncbi:MAG: FG-GAP-like repeat-containing protein [Acidobacteriota bacterium]
MTFTKQNIDTNFETENPFPVDIDGDGDLDVLGTNYFADDVVWWSNNNGSGTSWTERTIDGNFDGASEVIGADIDGDGDMDVVARALNADDVAWWSNNNGSGTSWTKRTIETNADGSKGLEVADINGDGHLDVVVVAGFQDRVTWWQNNGTGTSWTQRNIVTDYDFAHEADVFDADGDGDLDVAVAGNDFAKGGVSLYLNTNGAGTSWNRVQVEDDDYLQWYELAAGDLDGDGDEDLAAVFEFSGIGWWENNGSGTSWTFNNVYPSAFDFPIGLDIGDLDDDGDLDLAGAARLSHEVVWFENTGTAFIERSVATLQGAAGLRLADIDGNGSLDILSSGIDADDVVWYRSSLSTMAQCVAPPSNMRAWYPLDETSGNIANERVANNNGTHVNSPSKLSNGQVDGALDFDGFNDYVRASDNWRLDFGTGDLTIEGWVRTTDSNGVIVSKRALTGGKYVGYIFMVYNGRLLLQLGDSTSSWANYYSSSIPRLDDGAWHHVAVRVDRNQSSGGRMYIDGAQVYSFNPTNRQGSLSNSVNLELGRVGSSSYLDGTLDEITLYNRALSASQIQSIANAGTAGKCKLTPALSVALTCSSFGSGIHSCSASVSGGSAPYSYSWSYSGNGSISGNGAFATVFMGSCNLGGGAATVTVTDGNGTTKSATRLLLCDDTCPPNQICPILQ